MGKGFASATALEIAEALAGQTGDTPLNKDDRSIRHDDTGRNWHKKKSRPYPPDGYKQEMWLDDERVQISISLPQKDHLEICKLLPGLRLNRTQWIEKAVKEKLERDTP